MDNAESDRDSWETQGFFWLPDDVSLRLPGTLSFFREEGCVLRLVGMFKGIVGRVSSADRGRYSAIHGETHKYRRIFVVDAIDAGSKIDLGGGVNTCEFRSALVLTTNSAHDLAGTNLLTLRASLVNLETWLATSGFELQFTPSFDTITVIHKRLNPLKFDGEDGSSIQFSWGFHGPLVGIQSKFEMTEAAYVTVAYGGPRPIAKLEELLYRTADLIALGVGAPCADLHLSGKCAVPTTEEFIPEIDIWWKRTSPKREKPDLHDMVFSFPDVSDRFGTMLNAWFRILDTIEPSYQLYFGTMRSQTMYAEHRLFNLFQALESFHQRVINASDEAKTEAIAKRDRLIALAPKEDRTWLNEKLAFSHEPSAAERIKSLVRTFEAEWIFGGESWESTVQRIAKVRNYLTHFGQRKPPEADLALTSVWNFGSQLQVLCETVFLCQLSFSPSEVKALLLRNRRLSAISYKSI